MAFFVSKLQEKRRQLAVNDKIQKQNNKQTIDQFVDNRPDAITQRKLKETINNSPQTNRIAQLQSITSISFNSKQSSQRKVNHTGLPDNLKTGMEKLSGMSLDDVKVYRNSDKPAQLQAHAYAQGTNIHLGTGQEKHLPHELAHVVQQKQGRVKPTFQFKGKLNINDDVHLENEADVMGAKALHLAEQKPIQRKGDQFKTGMEEYANHSITNLSQHYSFVSNANTPVQRQLIKGKFNVVGEHHTESGNQRPLEKKMSAAMVGGGYWAEDQFRVHMDSESFFSKAKKVFLIDTYGAVADPFVLRILHSLLFLKDEASRTEATYLRANGWVGQLLTLIESMKGGYDGDDMSKPAQAALKKMKPTFIAWSKLPAPAIDHVVNQKIDAIIADWKVIAAKENVVRNKIPIKEIGRLDEQEDAEAKGAEVGGHDQRKKITSNVRSLAMFHSANEGVRVNTVGVWKIGQKHLDDIIKMPGITFSVTSREEFIDDLKVFEAASADPEIKDVSLKVRKENQTRKLKRALEEERQQQESLEREQAWQKYLQTTQQKELRTELEEKNKTNPGSVDVDGEIYRAFKVWRVAEVEAQESDLEHKQEPEDDRNRKNLLSYYGIEDGDDSTETDDNPTAGKGGTTDTTEV